MSAAPFTVNITASDDETFTFARAFAVASTGAARSFTDETVEYVVTQRGSEVFSGSSAVDDGAVVIDGGEVTFTLPNGTLTPGRYAHGCRVVDAGGVRAMLFSGTVTIIEGNFA